MAMSRSDRRSSRRSVSVRSPLTIHRHPPENEVMAKRPSRRSNSSASPSESAGAMGATGARRERQPAGADTSASADDRPQQAASSLNGPPPQAMSAPTTNPQELPKMASQNTVADSAPQSTQAGQPQSSAAPPETRFDIF